MAVASFAGIFTPSTYSQETPSWAIQGIAQDIANIVLAVPVLLISTYFLHKQSLKALPLWLGVLFYMAYSYAIYAFDIHFNFLFLIYVAVLGLSFYTIVGSVASLDFAHVSKLLSFNNDRKVKLVSAFLMLLAIFFAFLWLSDILSALFTNSAPQGVKEIGLPVNPIHVLDLAFALPGMAITSITLWRKYVLGYLFAVPFLVFGMLMGAAIISILIVSHMQGYPASFGVGVLITAIVLACSFLSILLLKEVRNS